MKVIISYTKAEAIQAACIIQQLREILPPVRVQNTTGEKYNHYYIKTRKQIDAAHK